MKAIEKNIHLFYEWSKQFTTKEISDWLIEEMGELIVALNHHRRKRVKDEQVLEEMADVMICLQQTFIVMSKGKPSDALELMLTKKLEKAKKRMNNDKRKKNEV